MRALLFTISASLVSIAPLCAEPLKVATLHPLLADLAREVGGDRVEVVELIGPNDDPHAFEPSPRQIRAAGEVDLCLASGMGLENYLGNLETLLPENSRLIEIGADLPAMEGACDHAGHDHGHDHAAHAPDPHWWHSVDAFRRATGLTAGHFAAADPNGAEVYHANAAAYRARLDELEKAVRRDIARIPRERRFLATAHDAFGYFCRDFGLTPIPVQGLNREQMPDAATLAELIAKLREHRVAAIFPEESSNPKILEALTADTGIRLAEPLYADGTGAAGYEEMIRHNVERIVAALK